MHELITHPRTSSFTQPLNMLFGELRAFQGRSHLSLAGPIIILPLLLPGHFSLASPACQVHELAWTWGQSPHSGSLCTIASPQGTPMVFRASSSGPWPCVLLSALSQVQLGTWWSVNSNTSILSSCTCTPWEAAEEIFKNSCHSERGGQYHSS